MKPETLTAIVMLLRADSTVGEEKMKEVLAACRREQRKHRKLITARKAAEILGCCTASVKRYARRGILTPIRFSARKVRYDQDEIEAFANEGLNRPGEDKP